MKRVNIVTLKSTQRLYNEHVQHIQCLPGAKSAMKTKLSVADHL